MDRTSVDPGDAPRLGHDRSWVSDRGYVDRRTSERLNDLCARALELDAERARTCRLVDEIVQSAAAQGVLVELERRRIDITAELEALRARIAEVRSGAGTGVSQP